MAEAFSPLVDADMPVVFELETVSEAEIRALNLQFRGVDAVTDVLSFPALENARRIRKAEHGSEADEEGRLLVGSVAVCEKRAREQAEEYGHSYARELYYLCVHGMLHCLGYDHETESEKTEMRGKEEEVMRRMDLSVE